MNALRELRGLLRLRPIQLLALSLWLSLLAAIALASGNTIRDPDIWWHLRTGDWIIAHRAVPYAGIFSRTAEARPWIAYSWGYEVLLSRAYAWFGLTGLALFGVVLTIAVAGVLFCTLYRLAGRFWTAWILALAGGFAFLFSLMPRPVFLTMILFAVELTLLLRAQHTGRIRTLFWLPPLFVAWANVHIQFIYGLAVLGLLFATNVLLHLAKRAGIRLNCVQQARLPLGGLGAIFLGSFAACCAGPYTYRLYGTVAAYAHERVPYFMIQELAAPHFRSPTHYVMLLLVAGAFYALGWQEKPDLFKLLLLAAASMAAFRAARDAWFVSICAAALIADARTTEDNPERVGKVSEWAAVWGLVAVFIFLTGRNTGFNPRELDRAVSRAYPVNALNFVRQNPFPGPLYNHLDWGGFLIWYLPQYPVAVDGRNDLYGDELDLRTYNTSQGEDYRTDPYLNEAGLVVLPRKLPLAVLLAVDSRFRLVYEDRLAVVFVRK
jgi:uncharacterized membrane protein